MGYRYDVLIILPKKTPNLKKMKVFEDCDSILDLKKHYAFIWEGCSWDVDFNKDVEYLDSVMNKLEKSGKADNFGFIMIGEELEDTEIRGCPYNFDCNISRVFSFPEDKTINQQEFYKSNAEHFIQEASNAKKTTRKNKKSVS